MGEGSLWKLKELSKQKEFEKAWGNNEKCKLDPEFSCISLAFLLPLPFLHCQFLGPRKAPGCQCPVQRGQHNWPGGRKDPGTVSLLWAKGKGSLSLEP